VKFPKPTKRPKRVPSGEPGFALPRPVSARSASYLRWIRRFPCLVCALKDEAQASRTESAHVWASSISLKSSDLTALPLCELHHRDDREGMDKMGREQFALRHNIDLDREIIKSLNRFVAEGNQF